MSGRSLAVALALFLSAVVVRTTSAQEPDSAALRAEFDSVVAANTYHARLEDGRLIGPAADWLVRRGREVDHFVVGERHGTREVPEVAATLYERLAPHGYHHAALEIGPYAAAAANRALERDGFDGLRALMTRYEGPNISFLHWEAESRMAARIHRAGGVLWGLDREFIGSLPRHLDALAEEAETEEERAAVGELRERAREEWSESYRALGHAHPDALRALRDAFEARGDRAALERIDAMMVSNRVYAPYVRDTGNFYDSRVEREQYMKRLLMEYVRDVESRTGNAPDVFYKHAHVSRKATDDHPFNPLGAFILEWARSRGEESFHIIADCHGGQIPRTGQGGGGECVSYLEMLSGGEGRSSPFSGHLSRDRVTVIDLRALRPGGYGRWDFLSEDLRQALLRVDAYLAIPDVTSSGPFATQGDDGSRGGGR